MISDKKTIRLTPVNMKVLVLLLKGEGDVVSREQLCAEVWPNQLVSDETLTKCISDIRVSLNKLAPETKFIQTIPKKGYQWLMPVSRSSAAIRGPKRYFESVNFLTVSSVVLLLVLTVMLWGKLFSPEQSQTNLVILPLRVETEQGRLAATMLEDKLRTFVVQSESLNLLSAEIFRDQEKSPVTYLNREHGLNWVLEGRVRPLPGGIRISMSLVDPNTAIVIHTRNAEFTGTEEDISQFSELLANEILRLQAGSDSSSLETPLME